MPYSDSKEQWFRDIIMDHYQMPRNKGLVDDKNYKTVHLKNPSCGDDLIVQVKLIDNKIVDIRFDGSGCAICCSSASIMSENIKNRTVEEARAIINNFSAMVSGKTDFDEKLLQEAVSLQGVAKLPPRIKCATLSYKALQQILFNEFIAEDGVEIQK